MATLDSIVVSWSRTRVQPLRVTAGVGHPSLGTEPAYRSAWDEALPGTPWQKPWFDEATYSNFWARELGGAYRVASGHKAWTTHTPLRRRTPPTLTCTLPDVALTCAQYLYPTGSGVLVTAEITGSREPAALLELVAQLSTAHVVSVDGRPPTAMAAVIGGLLDDVDRVVLPAPDPDVVDEPRLRTVATVTHAPGWDAAVIESGGPVHRLLAGLCLLSAAPLTGAVAPLEELQVKEPNANFPDTVRVATGTGQAVWSPIESAQPAPSTRLRCYHRNLALASMHTAVLLGTARWATQVPVATLPADARAALRAVLGILGRKYGKSDGVYATRLGRRQIDGSELVPSISSLRLQLGVGGPLT